MLVYAVDRPDVTPLAMPSRFKHDIAYFMTPPGERGAPPLAAGMYWIDPEDARRWLAEGVLMLVSPLDSENQAEVEISEEQEKWLEWLIANNIQRVRLEG
ncbi:MAG TPA: hypothetical protein VHV08_05510 [Pirellulales bacterium]|jgi:hypothetical protein|nr:hypothetical protein [Pirellulales bacterium]